MICNSTPLICLAKISKLDLLKKVFGKIIIPEEVRDEVIVEGKAGCELIKKAMDDGWIIVRKVGKILDLGLGKGENAAIGLAKELNDGLIIDDARGVKAARVLGIDVLRTTSVVMMCVRDKILGRRDGLEVINELIEIGYYIGPRVYVKLIEGLK